MSFEQTRYQQRPSGLYAKYQGASSVIKAQYISKEPNRPADPISYPKELESDLSLSSPETMEELLSRLNNLVGRSIGELALLAGVPLPVNNLASKGFAGQLVELFLGANAHNLSLPDFTQLNLEMKTIPLGVNLTPVESTFICATDLKSESFVPFEQSPLCHKLSNVLFVMLLAPKNFPMAERRILGYFFFKPNAEQLRIIKDDYQDFSDLVCSGQSESITGTMGSIIQMRPKGINGESLVQSRDSDGSLIYIKPRGFYLRRSFSSQLCRTFFEEQGITSDIIKVFQERMAFDPNETEEFDDD